MPLHNKRRGVGFLYLDIDTLRRITWVVTAIIARPGISTRVQYLKTSASDVQSYALLTGRFGIHNATAVRTLTQYRAGREFNCLPPKRGNLRFDQFAQQPFIGMLLMRPTTLASSAWSQRTRYHC